MDENGKFAESIKKRELGLTSIVPTYKKVTVSLDGHDEPKFPMRQPLNFFRKMPGINLQQVLIAMGSG
jgi:hypothetical protein